MQVLTRRGKSILILLACTTALALFVLAPMQGVAQKWRENLRDVTVLGGIARYDRADTPAAEVAAGDVCHPYVATIQTLYSVSFNEMAAEEQLLVIERLRQCLPDDRQSMLIPWISDAMWTLGRYDDACDLLVEVSTPERLLKLAQQSAEIRDLSAVESALACVRRFDPAGSWISPFIVAQLYHHLGQEYEALGQATKALAAYDAAADWFPVVWYEPYVRKAALLWTQDRQDEAIHWLIDGLSRSTDPTATFNLWRELGGYWRQQEELQNALCAYASALSIIDQVPDQNVAAIDRQKLQNAVEELSPWSTPMCFTRYPVLRSRSSAIE